MVHLKKEMKVQDGEHFLETLFDAVPSPIFFKDTRGIYRFFNKAFEEYMGMSRTEIIGKTDYDLNSERIAAAYHEIDLALMRDRQVQYYEVSVKNPDDSRTDIIFHKACCTDGDGSIVGLVGVLIDVTERRRVEEERERLAQELQKAKAEVKTLMGLLPICSYCRKVRDDEGYWSELEGYIEKRSRAKFSHGICDTCLKKHFPEHYSKRKIIKNGGPEDK